MSQKNLQKMIEELHEEDHKVGFKMNMKKTKVMFNSQLAGHHDQ